MPGVSTKAAVGFGRMLKAHAKDETTHGQDFTRLPPGVSGVAQLFAAKRGVYKTGKNAGKQFLQLRGTVLEPETHTFSERYWGASENGQPAGVRVLPPQTVKVAGRQTSLMLPMCDTATKDGKVTTAEEHITTLCNELRKLGGDDCLESLTELPDNCTEAQSNAALDPILDALTKANIRFKFSTRAGDPTAQYPTATTFESWLGADGLAAGQAGGEPPADAVDAGEQEAEATAAAGGDGIDLDGLLAAANKGDKEAQAALTEQAVAVGHSKEDAEGAADWDAVVALINNPPAAEGEGEAPAEEEAPWEPAAKETYGYKPLVKDAKGKLVAGKKQIDCSVVSVDKAKETCVLLNGIDKKTKYQNVPWTKLVRE